MSENSSTPDADELQRWREGMHALASLPQVYVKLSMLGYAVPGWIQTPERVALVKSLVREIVELFGPSRCMFAFNWWKDGPTSDADGMSTVGPNPVELVEYMSEWLSDYSEAERKDIFSGTARRFYRF
jgi:predicted TIM-barrel fold metal-dependent hydrolase